MRRATAQVQALEQVKQTQVRINQFLKIFTFF